MWMIFTQIFLNQVTPISVIIGLGVLVQKLFKLEIRTLSKMLLNVFLPAVIFIMVYKSALSLKVILLVLVFLGIYYAALFVVVEIYNRFQKRDPQRKGTIRNSVLLDNNGNYGIPLNQLVFAHNPLALSVQMIVLMVQTLLLNSVGVYNVCGKRDVKDFLGTMARMPSITCMSLAVICNYAHIRIPAFVFTPINAVAEGFLSVALLTLGVQLGGLAWRKIGGMDILFTFLIKLGLAPVIGIGLVYVFGLEGIVARALILTCCVPSSLTGALFATEFESDAEFASQASFSSTLLSVITVPVWIYIIKGMKI